MEAAAFRTSEGVAVPAVTADEMREVDRIAVEEMGLALLQMMENAGRTLARLGEELRREGRAVILAGGGGNGGGGLACARHLANRNVPVTVVVDRPPSTLAGPAATQLGILTRSGVPVVTDLPSRGSIGLVVDALIGYGLRGQARGRAAELIGRLEELQAPMLSVDVPSGIDATDGLGAGRAVVPDRTVTLALPKTGLEGLAGELYLADIAVPAAVYERVGIPYRDPFGECPWSRLVS